MLTSVFSKSYLALLILLVSLAVFTRFYKLETTATFFWDQAYDLRQIQIFYQEKRVTLIGPISEEGDKVYSSLTYYMLLPFAVLGEFSTISTTYGAALYGTATALLIIALVHSVNKPAWWGAALLVSIWFPLIESSRWAWNPHLVLFWIALALLFWQRKTRLTLVLSGLFFGLSIHHHFLSFFATFSFIFLNLVNEYRKKQPLQQKWVLVGYVFAISPFVLFDLTHPPGLFLSKFLAYQAGHVNRDMFAFLFAIGENFYTVVRHYGAYHFGGVLLLMYIPVLVLHDLKRSRDHLLYFSVWLLHILGVTLIREVYPHYFLPGLVFFVVYVFLPRTVKGFNLAVLSTAILLIGSVFSIIPQLTTQKYMPIIWQPNIRTVDAITHILAQEIKQKNLTGVNLAVLGSSDPNRYGWKYRSLLEIKGIHIKSKYEYFTNNYLFVVSLQSADQMRKDPAPEMERFRNEKLINTWSVPDSEWRVHLFSF